MKKLVLVLGLLGVLGGGAAYFFWPATEVQADDIEADEEKNVEQEEDIDHPTTAEISVGTFNCINNTPGGDVHLSVDVVIVVEESRREEIRALIIKYRSARVRHHIIAAIRSATLQEVSDTELTVLKAKVQEAINKVLERRAVLEVVFNNFG